MDIGPPELIIMLVLLLVLFGGSQLPKLARNLGKAQQEFKSGLAEFQKPDDKKAADVTPADVKPAAVVDPAAVVEAAVVDETATH